MIVGRFVLLTNFVIVIDIVSFVAAMILETFLLVSTGVNELRL